MPSSPLDANGQPDPAFNAQLRARRGIDEMLGLCRGIIFDGVVSESEATGLAEWMQHHPDIAVIWPANVVARRLDAIFADGIVTPDEREGLRELLEQVVGADPIAASEADWSSTLALDDPPPTIVIPDRRFCFTGKFFFGTRRACKTAIIDRGGQVLDAIRKDLDYLVVGLLGSRDWVHSTHGNKIQKAVDYRGKGLPIAIVSEKHWAGQLSQA